MSHYASHYKKRNMNKPELKPENLRMRKISLAVIRKRVAACRRQRAFCLQFVTRLETLIERVCERFDIMQKVQS